MKVKKGEFVVHKIIDDWLIKIEYRGRNIQMCSFMDDICFSVADENGNDDKEFFCLYEAMKYIDKVVK